MSRISNTESLLIAWQSVSSEYIRRQAWDEALSVWEYDADFMRSQFGDDHSLVILCMENCAVMLTNMGQLEKAKGLWLDVVAKSRSVLGDDDRNTLRRALSLAATYQILAEYENAEHLQSQTLQECEKKFGTRDSLTLDCMANLASTHKLQGRYPESETAARNILAIRKELPTRIGEEEQNGLSLAKAALDLGSVLAAQEKDSEAQPLFADAMTVRRRYLGNHHPDTLTCTASLAAIYINQGKRKEAVEILKPTIHQMKNVLGTRHRDTLTATGNLATALKQLGRYQEAEGILVALLDAMKDIFGAGHPETLFYTAELADTYHCQGEHARAKKMLDKSIAPMEEALGPEHPHVLSCKVRMIDVLVSLGDPREARRQGQALRPVVDRVLGQDNVEALSLLKDLAMTYQLEKQHEPTEELLREAVGRISTKFGLKHPATVIAMADLALSYQTSGKAERALKMVQIVLQNARCLVDRSTAQLTVMFKLATACRVAKRLKEAASLGAYVVDASSELLGADDPDRLMFISGLALTRQEQGRLGEARNLMTQACHGHAEQDSPAALVDKFNLAQIRLLQGYAEEALRAMDNMLPSLRTILGSEHNATVRCAAYLEIRDAQLRSRGSFPQMPNV